LQAFGNTQPGQKLLRIAARWLPTPILRFQGNGQIAVANASWDLRGARFASTSAITDLPLLNLVGGSPPAVFLNTMRRALVMHGLLPATSQAHFQEAQLNIGTFLPLSPQLETAITTRLRAMNVPPNTTVLVLIPKKEFDLYAVVKRVAELTLGIKTVLCTAPLVNNFQPQTASNLALKYNIKGMGDNHRLGPSELKPIRGADPNRAIDTIVLGADVGHPGKGCSPATPSIAGVVGSVDKEFMLYPGSMRLQPSGQDFIQDLTDMVKERILDWHKKNGKLPKRVLFYRDGVSESQYDVVREHEIPQIQKAFNKAQAVIAGTSTTADVQFELTFVVVGKRHNTRFYPLKHSDTFVKNNRGEENGNVKPGLVVDQVITHPFAMDFYLQSHNPIQGTGRSAHYYVITNGMNLSADELQSMTHSFCYTYARATKGVSYCAPAYYADRLCDRGRAWLRHFITNNTSGQPARARHTQLNPPESIAAYNDLMAQALSVDARYRPNGGDPQQYGGPRKNPWHQNLDGCMFYL
jgi:eukaryotic translation initiation factor 2C